MARSRIAAPSLARTRSAAPAVGAVVGYAAPELSAWVAANREVVLRAAEAVDAAYIAAVDALAPRLPGGEGAWERARGSVLFYDSEREEHFAKRPVTVEDVEGWQSRATDKHGKRSVVALLPVLSLDVANRWVHGFGSATGSGWTMTRTAPSPETPLELASYDIRRMGVDVTQRTGEDGGGGSTMPTLTLSPEAKFHYTSFIRLELARGGRAVVVSPTHLAFDIMGKPVHHSGVVVLDPQGHAVRGRGGILRPKNMEELLAAGLVAKTTDESETAYVAPAAKKGVTFGTTQRDVGDRETSYVEVYNNGKPIGSMTISHRYNRMAQQRQFQGITVELNEPTASADFGPVLRHLGVSSLGQFVKGEGYSDARTAMTAAKAWVREQVAKAAQASG